MNQNEVLLIPTLVRVQRRSYLWPMINLIFAPMYYRYSITLSNDRSTEEHSLSWGWYSHRVENFVACGGNWKHSKARGFCTWVCDVSQYKI